MVGDAYSKAYTNAQSAFFQDQSKKINAGNALAAVGNDTSKLNTQQIQDLMATGGLQRVLGQKQLDFNYQQFVENRDWSVNNLQPLLSSINAAKGTQSQTSNFGPPANVAGTAIGAAATIAGAYFTGGKSASAGPDTNLASQQENQAINDYSSNFSVDPIDTSSDERLKTDIVQVGHLPSGLPWYEFRYLKDPDQVHQGVLAHEAAQVFPEAVSEGPDGYLRVRYSRIH
jgi:hypothetical protein